MNKMYRSLNWVLLLAMLLGVMLTACQTAVETTVVPEPTVAIVEPAPTDVPPTATPEPEPTPVPTDWVAVFEGVTTSLTADNTYGTINAAKLNEELVEKPPFLLDIRDASELEANGFIAGAVNIPVRDVLNNLDKLPGLDDPIVIYCGSGHRGALLLPALNALGYTNVRNLVSGLGAWTKAGFAVEKGVLAAPVAISTPIIADEQLFLGLNEFYSNLPEGFLAVKADAYNEQLAAGATPFLLDIRTQKEWDELGYIEGATLVPYAELMASLDKLPADKATPIVIYCASGHRAGIVLAALHFMGYTDVRSLGGGINAWKAAKFPVEGWVDWNATWASFLSGLPADYYAVSAANLNTAMVEKMPFLLDVRTQSEVEAGYIAGAVHIEMREVLKNLDKLPAFDQPIVIYCGSGHRGALVLAALRMLGYTDVLNLAGGLNAWKKAELPVTTDPIVAPTAGTAPVVDQVIMAGLEKFFSTMPDSFYSVKVADLNVELGAEPKPFILDVRTAGELTEGGYIEGAVNVTITELFANLAQLPTDKATPIVVVCKSGHRGALGMMALMMNGYTNVRNMAGGMNAWIAAELPIAGK